MIEKQNIHFVGIGGIGMSAIAEILHGIGFKITGSDLNENIITKRLKKKGIKVFNKHESVNVSDADFLVYSTAIKRTNVEVKAAIKKKIPLYTRAMMLAEVMRLKPSITVSGSHGKTTTTSLISSILEFSGFDPTIINGGIINEINANAKLGKGKWIVAEADESDGSFKILPSTIGVINNIDFEHVDYYKNLKEIKKAFIEYSKNIPFYGFLSINIDDKNIRSIKKEIDQKKIITFGFSKNADFFIENQKVIQIKESFCSKFDIVINERKKKICKDIIIPLLGSHNILNATCSYSVAKGLKISDKKIKQALKDFKGVKRRFSIIYNKNKNIIIDDYAHHPKEILTTINSLRLITKNKIITVFEPHRFSRVKKMKKEFLDCFKNADSIFILPIYAAGENLDKNFNNETFSKLFKKKFNKKLIKSVQNNISFFKILSQHIERNDNVIFLGAGQSSIIANNFSTFFKNYVK